MFDHRVYPKKSYSTIEVYDILQHSAIKGTASRFCLSIKDWDDCANYLKNLLMTTELTSRDITFEIRNKKWASVNEFKKDQKLKSSCSCDAYDLLRNKGCDCGHIVPYKAKNIFT